MPAPYWIEPGSTDVSFPDVSLALREPDGLLAIGGDLTCERVISAYQQGIFPWFSEGQPILWWSPDPRFVLFPDNLKVSRSLRKTIKSRHFNITVNKAFDEVIDQCAKIPRAGQEGTWITQEMQQAYSQLHQQGYAVSVEAWHENKLVGGLYGIAIGRIFFGESMFSLVSNASKVAFSLFVAHLQGLGFKMLDCQIYTAHLESLGAEAIKRSRFTRLLNQYCEDHRQLIKPATCVIDTKITD